MAYVSFFRSGRHHIGVPGKHQMRRAFANARVEIFDRGGTRLRKTQALYVEPRAFKNTGQQLQRATFGRRH